jgi:hypothetical protein
VVGQLGQQCSTRFLAAEGSFPSCASRAIADPFAGVSRVCSLRGEEAMKHPVSDMVFLLYKLKEVLMRWQPGCEGGKIGRER